MVFISVAKAEEFTDRMGGAYVAAQAPLAAVAAKLVLLGDMFFGGASNGGVSIGDPAAQVTVGQQVRVAQNIVAGAGFYSSLLSLIISSMGSYTVQNGPGNVAAGVVDIVSFLRHSNGCPDVTPQALGAGSDFTYLAHPKYGDLINAILNNNSPLPPDVVFAPGGTVLGTYNAATNAFVAGVGAMMQAGVTPGSYAPVKPFTASTPAAGPALPNGSCFVTLTGKNQAGASVTWRGDIGTGLTAASQQLAAGVLKPTGFTNGGTAASTDRLLQVTGIARDTTVSSGGTATQGVFNVIALDERPTL